MAATKTLDARLKRYKERVSGSAKWRKKEQFHDTWDRMIDLYRGKHFSNLTYEDKIVVNEAFAIVNVIYPSVSVNQPKITVSARQPDNHAQSVIVETVVNYWWRHFDIKKEFRRAVKDYLIIGHGWLKVGWRYVTEEQPLSEQEYKDGAAKAMDEADQYAQENPHLAAQLPTNDEILANLPSTKHVVAHDAPFVERVSPFDIFVDTEATSETDLCWIAQRVIRPIEEVRSDPQYKKSARKNVKASAHIEQYEDEGSRNARRKDGEYPDDVQRCVVWEYYDLKDGHMCVFAEGGDDFLVEPVKQPYAYGHPFVMIRNYDVPDQFYPIGDLEAIEPMQLELNETRSQMVNHRRKFARKHLFRPDAFTEAGRAALEDDRDNVLVEVATDDPFDQVIAPLPQMDNLPSDFYNQSDLIEGDLQRVSGVNEYMRGAMPEIRRTATEASIIQDASNARSADKLAVVEQAIAEVGRRLVQLAQQYMTGQQMVRIVGNGGAQMWVPFDHDDIEGEYDFEVEGGSTMPKDENTKRQNAMAMLNALGPFIQTGVVNVPEILKIVLRDAFNVQQPEKLLQGPPPMPGMPGTPPPGVPGADAPPGAGGPDNAGGAGAALAAAAQAGGAPASASQAATSPIPGVPPEVVQQLIQQVGLSTGGGR